MSIECFEDIVAWQKSKQLTVHIYTTLKDNRDYSFRDQIQRASVSIMNNIAEGFERKSNKELKQFLFIAKGSCGEVRSMLKLGRELGYLSLAKGEELVELSYEISRLLSAFIKKI